MASQNKPHLGVEIVRGLVKVFLELIKYGGYVGIAYFVYKSLVALSGKATFTNIQVNSNFFDLSWCEIMGILSLFIAAICIMYAKSQAKLRKNTVEFLQGRIRELETRVDTGRTSSNLTVRGETREDDK